MTTEFDAINEEMNAFQALDDHEGWAHLRSVSKKVQKDGLLVQYPCAGCAQAMAPVFSWGEIAMLAHNVSPMALNGLTNLPWHKTPQGFQAELLCPHCRSGEVQVEISRKEAMEALDKALEGRVVRTDPSWPAVARYLNAKGAKLPP